MLERLLQYSLRNKVAPFVLASIFSHRPVLSSSASGGSIAAQWRERFVCCLIHDQDSTQNDFAIFPGAAGARAARRVPRLHFPSAARMNAATTRVPGDANGRMSLMVRSAHALVFASPLVRSRNPRIRA